MISTPTGKRNRLSLFAVITLSALSLSGCATKPTYIVRPVELPIPARPTLPHVEGASLMCLSDDAYTALVKRERAIKSYAAQLEAVIRANNEAAHEPKQ